MKKLVGFIIILGIILMLTACASVHHAPSDESEEPQIFAARDREAPTEYSEPEGTASAEAEEEVSGIKTQNVQIALANEDSPWRYPAGWQNELLNTFVDDNDDIRYFSILMNHSDGGDPYHMREMEDRANELAGAKISFDRENYRPEGWEPGGPYLSAF